METKILKISEIKLNPNNPRLIKDDKFEKLVNSIKEFPRSIILRFKTQFRCINFQQRNKRSME